MNHLEFYDQNKLCIIPLPTRSKAPTLEGWQKRTVDDNDVSKFSDEANVGVVLGDASSGLVDIDLDCDLARKLAPYFLPSTGWIFGRESARKAHYIYRVIGDAGQGKKFDCRGKFAEFRGSRQLTVFPPSIHPSGETIAFETSESIGTSTRAILLDSLSLMAICAVVEPHYVEGKRHDIVLALSGTLLKHNISCDAVVRVVSALCDLKSDEEKSVRLDDVRATSARRGSDLPFTQQAALTDLIGVESMNLLLHYLEVPNSIERASVSPNSRLVLGQDDLNDSGMAKLFADKVKDRVVFDVSYGSFAVYHDGIWVHEHLGLGVQRALGEVIQERIDELRKSKDVSHETCALQSKFLLGYLNRSKGQSAIHQSRAYLEVESGIFDRRDDVIAVRNGIISLQDGILHSPSPLNFVTKQLDVIFDPKADCPRFKGVLSDAFGGDEELIAYFQGVAGYWLTGSVNRQEMHFFYGEGANGKSTIINAISHVLGPCAGAMMTDTLFDTMGNQNSYDLASLRACRLAVVHEAESRLKLDSAQVKKLTGGDAIKARQLYRDPITFRPQFKIVVLCNKRPSMDAYDEALKRRIKLIPFDYVVPMDKRDPTLEDKLKLEAAGILNFLIEGARMHYEARIREPKAVTLATREYVFDQDSVSGFLKACAVKEPLATAGVGRLFETYGQYCADEGLPMLSKSDFRKVMIKMGFEDTRSASERQWKGLRLLSDDQSGER